MKMHLIFQQQMLLQHISVVVVVLSNFYHQSMVPLIQKLCDAAPGQITQLLQQLSESKHQLLNLDIQNIITITQQHAESLYYDTGAGASTIPLLKQCIVLQRRFASLEQLQETIRDAHAYHRSVVYKF
jgi:hypothetical protein